MRQLVAQRAAQPWSHGGESRDGNSDLAVVQCGGPRGSVGYIKKFLVGIEGNRDRRPRRCSQVTLQLVVLRLQDVEKIAAQAIGRLLPFVVQNKVMTFLLTEVGFR